MIAMIKGAMDELRVGDPGTLSTDVGPVIDDEARTGSTPMPRPTPPASCIVSGARQGLFHRPCC